MEKEYWIAIVLFACVIFVTPTLYFKIRNLLYRGKSREGFMDPTEPKYNITLYGATNNATTYLNDANKYYNGLLDAICGKDINQYRATYEDAIKSLEDILGLMVLQITLSIDVNTMTQQQIVNQMTKISDLVEAQLILSHITYPILDKLQNKQKPVTNDSCAT